jgi:hypothetical protein
VAQAAGAPGSFDPSPPGYDKDLDDALQNAPGPEDQDKGDLSNAKARQGVVHEAYQRYMRDRRLGHWTERNPQNGSLIRQRNDGFFGGPRWGLPRTHFSNGVVFEDRNQDGSMDIATYDVDDVHKFNDGARLNGTIDGNFNRDWVKDGARRPYLAPDD